MVADGSPELRTAEGSASGGIASTPFNPAGGPSTEKGSFVVFRLDGERFALPLDEVEIVLRMVSVTAVPDAPRWVIGAIDLRGRVVPVADLRTLLGRPAKAPCLDDRLLVLALAERTLALVVDEVTEVLELPFGEVEPPPGPLADSRYLKAVIGRKEGFILILDAAGLFPTAGAHSNAGRFAASHPPPGGPFPQESAR